MTVANNAFKGRRAVEENETRREDPPGLSTYQAAYLNPSCCVLVALPGTAKVPDDGHKFPRIHSGHVMLHHLHVRVPGWTFQDGKVKTLTYTTVGGRLGGVAQPSQLG